MKLAELQASFLAESSAFDKIFSLFFYLSLMKKILLILGLMLMLSACTQKAPVETDAMMASGPTNGTYEKDLREVSGKIKGSEEFKNCMDMNVPMCIQTAGMQLAQKERSTEVCNELPNADQRSSCIYAITIISAQEKNDVTLCNTLTGDYAAQCTINVIKSDAIAKKDPKVCEAIPATTEQNPGSTPRDECMLNAIVSNEASTAEACSAVQSKQVQEMCKAMISSRPKAQ
jgi:Prokaryotic membrane lipoprotein lipid attachment site